MKRLVFKRWVEVLVSMFMVLPLGLMMCLNWDVLSTLQMLVISVVCITLMVGNGLLLCAFGRGN